MAVPAIPTLRLAPSSEMEIGPDRGPQLADPAGVGHGAGVASAGAAFAEVLGALVDESAGLGQAAETQAADFARGRVDDLHGTMVALKKAQITLELVGSVRNKLLESFQELWRISV